MKDEKAVGLLFFLFGFAFLAYQFATELENQKKEKDER